MSIGLLGQKIGMTSVYDANGRLRPVTVIAAKNMGMPGHLGDERVTVQNLQVMQVRESEKIILVSGAVPGSNGSFVVVRPAIKKPAKKS